MTEKNIPAWHVAAWPQVAVGLGDFEALVRRMEHLGTSIHLGNSGDPQCGQMLYGADMAGEMVGIAWDWGRVRKACALADPMTLLSNIQLIGPGGVSIDDRLRLLYLSGAVRAFDWQMQIRDRRSPTEQAPERLAA